MESKGLRKVFAIFMIAFILSCSFAPSVSMAFLIKPGKPLTPGEAITPGQPISGGQFIIPGDPISGGKIYLPGSEIKGGKKPISGQPIIPQYQGIRGKFIIPNVAIPPGQWLYTGSPITSGEGPSGGQGLTGGTGPSGGQGLTGGTGPSGGQGLTGGTGPNGGQGLTGGTGPNGGQGPAGGTGPNGGQGPAGGTGPNGGEGPAGGTGPNGGQGPAGGTGPNGGQGPAGGTGPNGGEGPAGGTGPNEGQGPIGGTGPNGGQGPAGGNGPIGSENSEVEPESSPNYWGIAGKIIGKTSEWGISLIKPVIEGSIVRYAGFDLVINPAGNYTVVGKSNFNNKILNKIYKDYRYYDYHGNEHFMGGRPKDPYKVKDFLASKNLMLSKKDFLEVTWKNLKSNINDNFNVVSKNFRSLSNILHLGGPVGFAASAMQEFSGEEKLSLKFANFTVDLGIGAVATAASSVAASVAAYALAGTAVSPGVGTIIGAIVGAAIGFGVSELLDRKIGGKSIKSRAAEKLAIGYAYIGKGVKKSLNYGKGLFKSTIKRFGFG